MLTLIYTCLHKFFSNSFALVLMHLDLLARFVAQISTLSSILVPRMCVFYHNFYCIFSCYLLRWLNSCVNLTGVVQWFRLALSKGPNWVYVFPPPHLRTETDPVSETSCFLFSTIPDDGKNSQKPAILCVIHHRQNPLESTVLVITKAEE
jgi:hypothetical protein